MCVRVCVRFIPQEKLRRASNLRNKVAERIPRLRPRFTRATRILFAPVGAARATDPRQRTYEAEILRVDIYVLARVLAIGVNCAPNAIYFHRDGCSARTRFASARGLVNAGIALRIGNGNRIAIAFSRLEFER